MRALWKFAVRVGLAICVLVCSHAALELAHSVGWLPEQQLANLILAAPTALQIEVVMWSMLGLVVVGSLLLAHYFVPRRNYGKAWHKVRAKLSSLFRRRPVRKMPERVNRPAVPDYVLSNGPPPVLHETPGIHWTKKRSGQLMRLALNLLLLLLHQRLNR
jgi:hypothetical protein